MKREWRIGIVVLALILLILIGITLTGNVVDYPNGGGDDREKDDGGRVDLGEDEVPEGILRGDVNKDAIINMEDVNFLVNYLYVSGPAPDPLALGDLNGDGDLGIGDIALLTIYLREECNVPLLGELRMQTGDVNKDGKLDQADIDFLKDYLYFDGVAPEPMSLGDLNDDGLLAIGDLALLTDYISITKCVDDEPGFLEGTNYQVGDVNKDGKLDATDVDFLTAYLYLGGPVSSPEELGDLNGDGDIDMGDLALLNDFVGIKDCPSFGATYDLTYKKGDVNQDGVIDLDDSEFLVKYLYVDNANPPAIMDQGDLDGDGDLDIGDISILNSYLLPGCPEPIPFGVVDQCVDSDGWANYYIKGEATQGRIVVEDKCKDTDVLSEAYCDSGNPVVEEHTCIYGCADGACLLPNPGEEVSGTTCDALVEGGPGIPIKTRVQKDGVVKYCDVTTLDYQTVKVLNSICVENYECNSNVCMDGKCTSIRGELERQAGILNQILCWIKSVFSSEDYDTCIVPSPEPPEPNPVTISDSSVV